MHVVVYLSAGFYAAIAATIIETLQAVNSVSGAKVFSFEFVAKKARAVSRSGIRFQANTEPSQKMDVLILLAGAESEAAQTIQLLDRETKYVLPVIHDAQRQGSIIAATCGASYFLAGSGMLDGKRSTISWWLKKEASRHFPAVRWEPSRMIIRQGRIYTTGAGFSGLELITTLLLDLGFSKEERQVRKVMVLPPSRQFQTPYEDSFPEMVDPFEKKLNQLSREHIRDLDLHFLALRLGMSSRTLARRFVNELRITPGKWIREKRLEMARTLLETTRLSVSEICARVGYQDVASFGRLFVKSTGMPPADFRRQIVSR
ncbi:MAG TPA: helix-turn-helix domain-containing protein [Chthoniobacterales bacterium]|jgi:transcriptional regulator GlxA family with amidase domain|nr:helix-turn-helix domain-containing protein [Chthoniobacterales bacterium]